jgi:hypothetical protein
MLLFYHSESGNVTCGSIRGQDKLFIVYELLDSMNFTILISFYMRRTNKIRVGDP